MSAADHILKNFALFVDGRGYVGNCDELQPPSLALVTEDYRAGGMDAPISLDMGMEKLECSFTVSKQCEHLLGQFGVSANNGVQLTARGALESLDGTVIPVALNMRGTVVKIELGSWKPGEKSTLSVTVSLTYYKREQNGSVLHEIDVLNMKRIIGGTDRLAAIRDACGI
ncbi:MAG: phage major tail tube protein [Proteobacteria bacterium]|nr:phage major tail tube protein [Pseudomonadota bacterium]